LPPGPKNTIADVGGIRVGHFTKLEGDDIRTGITLIDPWTKDLFIKKLPAAVAVGNGFGKLAGSTQVDEMGVIETPIALTNVLAVGPVMRGVVDIMLKTTSVLSPLDAINVVVGEINDGRLNDIHQDVLKKEDVQKAFDALSSEVQIGNIGAGTGARAFSWKGGIGTASRTITVAGARYTLGMLVLTNYGGSLTILGVPIGKILDKTDFSDITSAHDGGSCIVVLATDAPVTSRQLMRLARRSFLGLARTGSVMSHASGDYAIAFSTNRAGLEGSGTIGVCMEDKNLTGFFLAAVESVEEGVYDALFAAETMRGRGGNILESLPVDAVLHLLRKSIHTTP